VQWLVAAALCGSCISCSINYTDSNGNRHIIGLVDYTVHPSAAPDTFAGDVVDVTSLGLSVGNTPERTFLAIGYSREVTASLRNNIVVVGNPLALLGDKK
jgi:hypothetical protein